MDKKDQRINVTLFSTQEYKMVEALAEPDLSFNDDEDPHFWRGK